MWLYSGRWFVFSSTGPQTWFAVVSWGRSCFYASGRRYTSFAVVSWARGCVSETAVGSAGSAASVGEVASAASVAGGSGTAASAVSYTHLTLPTNGEVYISASAVSYKENHVATYTPLHLYSVMLCYI